MAIGYRQWAIDLIILFVSHRQLPIAHRPIFIVSGSEFAPSVLHQSVRPLASGDRTSTGSALPDPHSLAHDAWLAPAPQLRTGHLWRPETGPSSNHPAPCHPMTGERQATGYRSAPDQVVDPC